jgi:hypothetical protein
MERPSVNQKSAPRSNPRAKTADLAKVSGASYVVAHQKTPEK